jgi:SSS family solute:Na+ symporter
VDWLFIGLHLAIIGGLSIWSIRKSKASPSDYFLANRNLGWFVIGASILASNVGSEHIVELAGTAANSGLVMGHYELHSWIILLLGWVFVPLYMRSMVYTMPEFLERRFNAKSRILLSVIQLLNYVITKASVTIFAAVAEDKRASRLSWNAWDVWLSIIVIALIIAVFGYFSPLCIAK